MSDRVSLADEIADVIGDDLTATLLGELGGTEISVAAKPSGTLLARTVGVSAAKKLEDHFGQGRLLLPCGVYRGREKQRVAARRKALDLLQKGQSERAVALACGLHLRTVKRYAAELGGADDPRQSSMKF